MFITLLPEPFQYFDEFPYNHSSALIDFILINNIIILLTIVIIENMENTENYWVEYKIHL